VKTKNFYKQPIDLNKVTKVAKDGIAHVGDLIHSIDYDAPEGVEVLAAKHGTMFRHATRTNREALVEILRG
jgi:hypothetical protein